MATTLDGDHGSSCLTKQQLRILRQLERKVLWLSSWMIHNANNLRPKPDGLKVGGHQASSASLSTIMTALYFHLLRPEDRIAVKPHASPIFHSIQYLLGNQSLEKLQRYRGYHGAQAYPSRTKDSDDVDFSTGSMGMGVAQTAFASLAQDYVRLKGWRSDREPDGRMIALVGDAELDEGNLYEALYESWKHRLRNVCWIVDYNRQSLDAVVTDRLFGQIDHLFRMMDWRVITLKYGRQLQRAFESPGGGDLQRWLDTCPNTTYSRLVYQGGAAWRQQILSEIGTPQITGLLEQYDDGQLHRLMTNLAGHDMEVLCDSLSEIDPQVPTCVIAYTIKGYGLPMAGHKDNHAGLMTADQIDKLRIDMNIAAGDEWEPLAGLESEPDELRSYLADVPFVQCKSRRFQAAKLEIPASIKSETDKPVSTQEGFGRIMFDLARQGGPLVDRIITTSPDVAVSTNLGGWINRRGVFHRQTADADESLAQVASLQKWELSPAGQHIELGIAENNLFLMLSALGLCHDLFGQRLIPIGTLYDPFINRGLDALNYACYQDARFILVASPSGISLAAEGGSHQSLGTPLIGMAQDGIAAFEPAYVDELATVLRWAFDYIQRDGGGTDSSPWLRDSNGGSVYLRLTTRPIAQPARELKPDQQQAIVEGGYWLREPAPGAELAIVYSGAVAPQAAEACEQLLEDIPGAGLLAVTSADRLNAGWQAARRAQHDTWKTEPSRIESLLEPLAADAALVTVTDGHPATLAWLGAVRGQAVESLGVEHFGQSGNVADLYRHYGLDVDTILEACASACLKRLAS